MTDEKQQALANLRERVRLSGLSRTEIAERLGHDEGHLSRLLNGKNVLNLDQQTRLAAILDCPVYDLFLDPAKSRETFLSSGVKQVPIINPDVLSVVGLDAMDAIISSWRGPRMLAPNDQNTQFAVEVTDDSMSKVAPVGALLMIDSEAREFTDGTIMLIRHNGRVMARRASGEGARRRLEAETTGQGREPIYLDDEPEPELLGTVRGIYTKV